MPMKSRFSAVFCALYFLTNVAALHSTEKNFWEERRRSSQRQQNSPLMMASLSSGSSPSVQSFLNKMPSLSPNALAPALESHVAQNIPKGFAENHKALLGALPFAQGTIRKITLPTGLLAKQGSRVVVHIQDVHHNEDAQKNIGQAIQSLAAKDQAPLIALEGAFAPINLSGLRGFSRQDVLKKLSDYLLRTHKISGPIHAALTGPKAFNQIIGIDDPTHYNANVEAYRQSAPLIQATKNRLSTLRSDLNKQKANLFSKELLDFDRKVLSYHDGKTNLGDHVKNLAAHAPEKDQTIATKQFLKTLAMESALNFKEVEFQRTQLVEALVKKLNKSQTDALIQQSMAYRAGQLRYADFYQSLQTLCEKNGITLNKFLAMAEYVKYVLSADRIEPDRLMEDMATMEKAAYSRLAKTKEEAALIARSRRLTLASKMVDFALIPEEYREYTETDMASLEIPELKTFEGFYKEAQARDAAMANNLIRAMDDKKTDTAVLVTGGYHAGGMAERLKKAGVAVVSFTPKIEKIDTLQGSSYLGVFTQEKTPLEKMFQGRTLFLASNPAGGVLTAKPDLVAGVVGADVEAGVDTGAIKKDLKEVVEELKAIAAGPVDFNVPKFEVNRMADATEVILTIGSGDSVRRVRYTVVFDKAGNYHRVESVDLIDPMGKVIESAREIAPSAAQEIQARVKALFGQRHGEHIAELPIMGLLPDFGLGELAWVLNLHQDKNVDLADLVARIVKMETLRLATQMARAGQLQLNLFGTPWLREAFSSVRESDSFGMVNAAVHYLLNYRADGSSRGGQLQVDAAIGNDLELLRVARNLIVKKQVDADPQAIAAAQSAWGRIVVTFNPGETLDAWMIRHSYSPSSYEAANIRVVLNDGTLAEFFAKKSTPAIANRQQPSLDEANALSLEKRLSLLVESLREAMDLITDGYWYSNKKPIPADKRPARRDLMEARAKAVEFFVQNRDLMPRGGESGFEWIERMDAARATLQQNALEAQKAGNNSEFEKIFAEFNLLIRIRNGIVAAQSDAAGHLEEDFDPTSAILDYFQFRDYYKMYLEAMARKPVPDPFTPAVSPASPAIFSLHDDLTTLIEGRASILRMDVGGGPLTEDTIERLQAAFDRVIKDRPGDNNSLDVWIHSAGFDSYAGATVRLALTDGTIQKFLSSSESAPGAGDTKQQAYAYMDGLREGLKKVAVLVSASDQRVQQVDINLVRQAIESGSIVYSADLEGLHFAAKPNGTPYTLIDLQQAARPAAGPAEPAAPVHPPSQGSSRDEAAYQKISGQMTELTAKLADHWAALDPLVGLNLITPKLVALETEIGNRSDLGDLLEKIRALREEYRQLGYFGTVKNAMRDKFRNDFSSRDGRPSLFLNGGVAPDLKQLSETQMRQLAADIDQWESTHFSGIQATDRISSGTADRLKTAMKSLLLPVRKGIEQRRSDIKGEALARIERLERLHERVANGEVPNTAHVFDIHGDPGILDEVIADVQAGRVQKVVFHGDAFDRGSANLGVFDRLKKLKELLGDNFALVIGNHDVWMIQALMLEDDEAMLQWFMNGGGAAFQEAGFQGDFGAIVQDFLAKGQQSRLFLFFRELRKDPRVEKIRQIGVWMLANQDFFHIDEREFLHVHAGIPLDAQGRPLIDRAKLDAAQARLVALRRAMAPNGFLNAEQKAAVAALFDEMKEVFWVREEGWLNQVAGLGQLEVAPQHQAFVNQVREQLPQLIRQKSPSGTALSQEKIEAMVSQLLPKILAQNNIPFKRTAPRVNREKLDELLNELDVQGIMFGHNHHAEVQNIDARIIGADVDQHVFLRFDGQGMRARDMRESDESPILSKDAFLERLQKQLDELRALAGLPAKVEAPVQVTPAEPAHPIAVRPAVPPTPTPASKNNVSVSKADLLATLQKMRVSWGNEMFSVWARVATSDPREVRLSIRIGQKRSDREYTLREGESLFVGKTGREYIVVAGKEPPSGMKISRTLTNAPGRIVVSAGEGPTSSTTAGLIPDEVAMATKQISSQQHALMLMAQFIRQYAFDSSTNKPGSTRNTWLSSDLIGYGLFVGIAAVLAAFFGIDLTEMSMPIKTLLLGIAAPLSMVTTSTLGIAAMWERRLRGKDPKAWALNHGVKEGSAEYDAYIANAERIAQAGRDAAAAGRSAFWVEVGEHNRLNRAYFLGLAAALLQKVDRGLKGMTVRLGMSPTSFLQYQADRLLSHSRSLAPDKTTLARATSFPVRTPPVTLSDDEKNLVQAIVKLMPSAAQGTYSVNNALRAALVSPDVDKDALAQVLLDQIRQSNETVTEQVAMDWLVSQVANLDTTRATIVPLSPELLSNETALTTVVGAALALHKGPIQFAHEPGTTIPAAIRNRVAARPNAAIVGREGLFSGTTLNLVSIQLDIPISASSVQVYEPEGYTADRSGVTDERLLKEDAIVPMKGLSELFENMLEMARLIATQA